MRGESLTFLGAHEGQVADPVIEAGKTLRNRQRSAPKLMQESKREKHRKFTSSCMFECPPWHFARLFAESLLGCGGGRERY